MTEKKDKRPFVQGVPVDRIVGKTPDGRTVGAIAAINPEGLPSDDFLLALTQQIADSGEGVTVLYDAQENIVEQKPLKKS
ncbi:hypothetical protein ACFL18_00630 [Patescibacteria group bacterium]